MQQERGALLKETEGRLRVRTEGTQPALLSEAGQAIKGAAYAEEDDREVQEPAQLKRRNSIG